MGDEGMWLHKPPLKQVAEKCHFEPRRSGSTICKRRASVSIPVPDPQQGDSINDLAFMLQSQVEVALQRSTGEKYGADAFCQ
jgi:hypothetical protein